MYKLSEDQRIARRQRMERAIVRRVVKDALSAGYVLDVAAGSEELAVRAATTLQAAMRALLNTDEDHLILRRLDDRGLLAGQGWVRFIYGNDGRDVICDYSVNIAPLMAGAEALADRLEVRQRCRPAEGEAARPPITTITHILRWDSHWLSIELACGHGRRIRRTQLARKRLFVGKQMVCQECRLAHAAAD